MRVSVSHIQLETLYNVDRLFSKHYEDKFETECKTKSEDKSLSAYEALQL